MKNVIFIASDYNYMQWTNALLNSIDYRGVKSDVVVLSYGVPNWYKKEAKRLFNYNIEFIEDQNFESNIAYVMNKNLYTKKRRFTYLLDVCKSYKTTCMLDADMMITSRNFNNLFDLVTGTNKLIGCEESIKWTFDDKYLDNGKPIFDKSVKAYKFMCSVPIIFNSEAWREVFEYYIHLIEHGTEYHPKKGLIPHIGDIFSWNISVYKNNRQNDCVLLPMHSMTQVHGTYGHHFCGLKKENDYIYTKDGCEVYSLHGRPGRPGWSDSPEGWYSRSLQSSGIEYNDLLKTGWNKSIDIVNTEFDKLNNYKIKWHLK